MSLAGRWMRRVRMSASSCCSTDGKAAEEIVPPRLRTSHDGRALVPIPKRSTSPRATSTLQWWIVEALDPIRPIREATE